jgi:hypothetical protein
MRTRRSNCSSSCRAASPSAEEAALTNTLRSNGALKRTTQRPPASPDAWFPNTARIWRLSWVRVTDRRAWRLGTTAPNQDCPDCGTGRCVTSTQSSTDRGRIDASPVDNSGGAVRGAGLAGRAGQHCKWCTAKCSLRALGPARSIRWKSADRTRRPVMATARPDRDAVPASARGSDGQALAALGATRIDDRAATAGLHADEETVGASAADFGSLVGTFHDQFSGRLYTVSSAPGHGKPQGPTLTACCRDPDAGRPAKRTRR